QGVKLTGASIDSASTLSVAKVVVSGALEATGATTLGNTLTVSGKTNLNGGLAVAGADVTIGSPATNQNLSVFGLGVLKKLVVTDTGSVAFRHMRDGTLTIGNITESFGGATDNFASNNIAGLLLETKDNTEIAVHDSEHRVASLMYYEGGTSNRVTIGRNMGWGALGSLNVAAALNATGATTLSDTLTVSGKTNLNGGLAVPGLADVKNLYVSGNATISGPRLSVTGGSSAGSLEASLSTSSVVFTNIANSAGALVYLSGKGFELQDVSNGFTRYDDLKLRNLEMTGTLKVGSNGVVVCPETTRIIRGTVNANGTISAGAGYTITKKTATLGVYDINFNAAFGSPPSVVVTQIYPGNDTDTSGDTRDNAVVVSISNNKARIKTGDSTGAAADRQFTFIAIGP
ncbi:MAG TPA: hypothetical protein PK156_19900, partial [Polyangium sp.]|nr:hypothetical protein [Polyangium sp.]